MCGRGLTQGGRGLTPDAGADANAAALQGLPGSAVASGNAPARRQNLQVRARAEGAAPGLSASENLAGTDGGKRAPVAGKRPDTVLPVLNPQVAESAGRVSPKKRMADAAADFTRRLAADRRRPEKAGVPLGAANTVSSIRTAGILMRLRACRAGRAKAACRRSLPIWPVLPTLTALSPTVAVI